MGRFLRVAGIIAAIFVGIVIVAAVSLRLMYPPERIKQLIMPHIEKTLGRQVQVEKIGLSVFPVLGVRVQGLGVANTARSEFAVDTQFVKLEEFLLRVKLLPLLQKRLDIATITLRRPVILVETDSRGSFNFEDLAVLAKDSTKKTEEKSSGPANLPIPLALEKFVIEEGSVIYHDRKGGMRLELGRIDQTIDFTIDQQLKDITTAGRLVVSDVSYLSKDVKKPITGLSITFAHDLGINLVDGVLTIKDVRASLQKLFISLTGTVKNFNAVPEIHLAIKTDRFSLADVLAEIPAAMVPEAAKTKGSGFAQLSITAQGVLAPGVLPRVKGQFVLNEGTIHYTELPQSINNLNADIGFTENSLNIAKLTMNLGKNPIRLRALVEDFKQPRIDADLDAVVNLDEMKNVIKLEKGNSLGGTIEAKVVAKGAVDPSDPAKLDLKGNLALRNVMVVTPAVTTPVVMNGTVDLTSKRIAQKMTVALGGSSMNISADFVDFLTLALPDSTKKQPRPRLTFAIVSPLLNTNEFLPQEKKTGQESAPAAASQAQDPLLFPAPLPGIDMVGSVTNTKLLYQEFDLSNLVLKYSCINDQMLFDVKALMFGGAFAHDLRMDLRNIRDLKIRSILSVKDVEISKLVGATKGFIPGGSPLTMEIRKLDKSLFGKASVQNDFITHGATSREITKNLEGTISLKLADGHIVKGALLSSISTAIERFHKIGDLRFRDMSVNARVKDEKLYIEDIALGSQETGDWGVKGGVGFDLSLDLSLSNRLTKTVSQPIVAGQSKIQGAAKDAVAGALRKFGVSNAGAVTGLVDGVGIPVDKDGRVTLLLGLGGSLLKPRPTFKGFGGDRAAASPQQTVQQQIGQRLKGELTEKTAELEAQARQKLAEEQQKLQAEAARQKAELERRAAEAKVKVQEDLKKKAAGQLKKLF